MTEDDKKDSAQTIDVSPRTVDNLMVRRAIPFVKIGHIVRFDVEKVKALHFA